MQRRFPLNCDATVFKNRVQKTRKPFIQFLAPKGRHPFAPDFALVDDPSLSQDPKVVTKGGRRYVHGKSATCPFLAIIKIGDEGEPCPVAEGFQHVEDLDVVEIRLL